MGRNLDRDLAKAAAEYENELRANGLDPRVAAKRAEQHLTHLTAVANRKPNDSGSGK